jgi:Na+-driven multidrug efflux pump
MLIVICTVMIIWRGFWVSCYRLSDQSAMLAQGLILAHSAAMVLWPVAFMLPYYFRATGRAAFTMVTALFAMAVFRIGLAYIFIKLLNKNVIWVWYAMFVDWIYRCVVYEAAFRRPQESPEIGKN